jgi:hypothetical protein
MPFNDESKLINNGVKAQDRSARGQEGGLPPLFMSDSVSALKLNRRAKPDIKDAHHHVKEKRTLAAK